MRLSLIKKSLDRKVEHIGIDLDFKSKKKLQQVLNTLKTNFPNVPIIYRNSANGNYHVRVLKPVTLLENLLYRAMYYDDETRLKLSLLKLAISNGKERHCDLLFNEKNNKRSGEWKKA